MATKFLRFLNLKAKKPDKDNQVDDDDTNGITTRQKHVNFRESYRSSLKSGRKAQQHYNHIEDDDDDSSEVTLMPPPNPYHVITEPKRDRGPRSFAAGEDLGSGFRGADGIGANDTSFHSEFLPPRNDGGSVCGGGGRQRRRNLDVGRFRFFSTHSSDDSTTLKDIGNNGGGDGIVASSSRCLKSLRNGRYKNVAASNNDDEKEDNQRWTEQRMKKYENKCQELAELLSIAINDVRTEKARRKHFQKLLTEATSELHIQHQVEEKLRRDIREYQEYTKELLTELRYYRLVAKDSQLAADSNHHTHFGPSNCYGTQTNTHTTASSMTSAGGFNPIGRQCQQRHHHFAGGSQIGSGPSALGGSNRVFTSDIDEALTSAGLSTSSFCKYKQNSSGQIGSVPPPTSSVSLDSAATTVGMDGLAVGSPIVFRNPLVNEDTSDEVKIFRNQHTDSFSGSSRPGTIDNQEMNEIKEELTKDLFSGGTSRDTSRSNDISSSPELDRNAAVGQLEGAQSCLAISFRANDDGSFICPDTESGTTTDTGTLTLRATKDDGYATSETTNTTSEKISLFAAKSRNSVTIETKNQPLPRSSSCVL